MLKLLSRSKYEEFESNSALQIRDQKERIAENARKLEPQEIWQTAKFSQDPKNSQLANFHKLRKLLPVHYSPACTVHISATVHPSCCFTLLPVCYNFLFLPILSLVIAFGFVFFCNFPFSEHYISSVKPCTNQSLLQ